MKKSELYYEEIGDHFDSWMSLYDVQQRIKLISKLMPQHSKDMNCLEIGCGTGKISEVVAQKVKSLTVSDISEKLAKSVGDRLAIASKKINATQIDCSDKSFDLVISSECIEHTSDPAKALSEMARILTDNGVLIVTSPNKVWYPILWLAMATKLRKYSGNENWLFPWQASCVLKKKQMSNIKITGCHLMPWQIPLAKHFVFLFDHFGPVLFPLMINYGIYAKKKPT